jgi:hypothetical protein
MLLGAEKPKAPDLRLRGSRRRSPSCKIAAMAQGKRVTCKDCFFHQNHLCALKLDEPCTTFRPAERGLAPERQLAFVFRTERTRSAYAFPPPNR